MASIRRIVPVISAAILFLVGPSKAQTMEAATSSFEPRVTGFAQNVGQWDPSVRFRAAVEDGHVWVLDDGLVFDYSRRKSEDLTQRHVVGMTFLDGRAARFEVGDDITSRLNIYSGNDPALWHEGIPVYSELQAVDVYTGIDVRIRTEEERLRYDFVIRPGADPSVIKAKFDGQRSLRSIDGHKFVFETELGQVSHTNLRSYQPVGTTNKALDPIQSEFIVDGDEVSFKIGDYDPDRSIVIDPLVVTRFLGGTSSDIPNDVAVAPDGSIVLAGETESLEFPGFKGDSLQGIREDIVVARMPSGTGAPVWSCIIGGSASDIAWGVDTDGEIVAVTGQTFSSDLPTVEAFQSAFGSDVDFFVHTLDAESGTVRWGTYLGGRSDDTGQDVEIGPDGSIYVGGWSWSSNFPTTFDAFQRENAGAADAVVARLSPSGSRLLFSTYLGGSNTETAQVDLAVGRDGSVAVAGTTTSPDLPVVNAAYPSYSGSNDGFSGRLNAIGSDLIYLTYLGGSGDDRAWGSAVDKQLRVYVVGETASTNFPSQGTTAALQNQDAYLTRFSPDGVVEFSSVLGGDQRDLARAVAVDELGTAYVVGWTRSFDKWRATEMSVARSDSMDVLLYVVDDDSSQPRFVSVFGGTGQEEATSVSSLGDGEIVIAGQTSSDKLPARDVDDGSPYQCCRSDFFVSIWTNTASTSSERLIDLSTSSSRPELQLFPNPIEDRATAVIQIRTAGYVTLEAYDILGRVVRVLIDGTVDSPKTVVLWDRDGLAPGVYVMRLAVGQAVVTRPIVVGR